LFLRWRLLRSVVVLVSVVFNGTGDGSIDDDEDDDETAAAE
jgi:hypothetical protein